MEKRPIAYQIYSAREAAEKNLSDVLAQLAQMGYQGVEFAGFYGIDSDEIVALLARYNLQAISSHVALPLIEADMFGVLSYHRRIGCKYIAIPAVPGEMRPGEPGFARLLPLVYKFGALCREAGIQLLYHNHDFEFTKVSGQWGLDFLYEATPADLLQTEIDTCWVKYAGLDPAAYVRQYAGRCPIVHLKDYVGTRGETSPYGLIGLAGEENAAATDTPFEFRPFGYGSQNAEAIVRAGIESGAKWFVVEQDVSTARTPLEDAALSIETLRGLGVAQ